MEDWVLVKRSVYVRYKSNYIFKCCQVQFHSSLYCKLSCSNGKLNNFKFKLLPFLLDDFLGVCGRRRSRDLIYITLM